MLNPLTRDFYVFSSGSLSAFRKSKNDVFMKKIAYLLVMIFGLMAASCTEEVVSPHEDDDPIIIPPTPPK
jgi:hypothetical protein